MLIQNEDGVENTLGTTNYSFSLFFMKTDSFILKAASSILRSLLTLESSILKTNITQATSTRIRFHSVFILFQVMGPLFSTPLRTENNIKTLGKRIRVDVASM